MTFPNDNSYASLYKPTNDGPVTPNSYSKRTCVNKPKRFPRITFMDIEEFFVDIDFKSLVRNKYYFRSDGCIFERYYQTKRDFLYRTSMLLENRTLNSVVLLVIKENNYQHFRLRMVKNFKPDSEYKNFIFYSHPYKIAVKLIFHQKSRNAYYEYFSLEEIKAQLDKMKERLYASVGKDSPKKNSN